jgi:hypothetical protein
MSSDSLKKISYNDIRIVTYPRSGLNFFRELLEQQGHSFDASHSTDKFGKGVIPITIARNPIDSVCSHFAMVSFYIGGGEYLLLEKFLESYIKDYEWFLSNNAYIISYEDLVEDPKKTIKEFLTNLSLSHTDIEYNINTLRDDSSKQYLVTSKTQPSYEKAKKLILQAKNLEKAKDLYNQALLHKWVPNDEIFEKGE